MGAATSLRMTRTTTFGFWVYSSTYGRPIIYLMGGSLVEVHSSRYFCLSRARVVLSWGARALLLQPSAQGARSGTAKVP
jgi:hypothetical protein